MASLLRRTSRGEIDTAIQMDGTPSLMHHNQAVASQLDLTDLSTAIRSEYARIFTERRDDLIAVGCNALLVTICWFLLPDKIVNWLFTLHGPLAFPYFLEMWMLGDT